MATNATTIISIIAKFEKDRSIEDLIQTIATQNDSKQTYTNGTGSEKVNKIHATRYTLTSASGSDEIDLGLITDPAGDRINFSIVRFVYVKNREPDGGSILTVGGATTLAWTAPFDGSTTAKQTIHPGGEWFISSPFDGLAVTAGSRVLRFENDGASSGDLDYDVIIAGEP